MSIQGRRERERAQRERLIIDAARELAEAEGWEAVTTRRLAERVEYSQPVLYSHFSGKGAIMTAVAREGFVEMAAELAAGRAAAPPADGLAAVARVYTDFGARRPALYDAMFGQNVDLPFATAEAPPALHACFDELAAAVKPHATPDEDLGLLTETFWAALHGLVTLMRGGRLPAVAHERRLKILQDRFTGVAGA